MLYVIPVSFSRCLLCRLLDLDSTSLGHAVFVSCLTMLQLPLVTPPCHVRPTHPLFYAASTFLHMGMFLLHKYERYMNMT